MDKLKINTPQLKIDFELRSMRTIIQGNTATGKTYVYKLLNMELSDSLEYNILFINYEMVMGKSNAKAIGEIIKNSKDKFIIIDQADIIFERHPDFEDIINEDYNNQYILIGRGLNIYSNISDLAELEIKEGKAYLKYLFPRPL